MSRANISLRTKLASALLALGHVPYEDAKRMSAAQICSLYAFDHHPVRHADGGPGEPWNLVPRLIAEHRRKTAKIDAPDMARERRVRRSHADHLRRMAAKEPGKDAREPSSKWRRRS